MEVILKIIGEIIIPALRAGMMISPDVFWITSGDTLETRWIPTLKRRSVWSRR